MKFVFAIFLLVITSLLILADSNRSDGIESGVFGSAGVPMLSIVESDFNTILIDGENPSDSLGCSTAGAGDVNSDGFEDVLIGAKGFSLNTGRAYIHLGSSSMDNVPDIILNGENQGDEFGCSVSSAGDVNNDGFDDVIVGAQGYSSATGRAYIFFGGTSMDNTPDVILTGEAASSYFGRSVSSGGDVNNDNYDEVVVGADRYSQVLSDAGKAYLFYGGASMNNVPDLTFASNNQGSRFGTAIGSGDVNNDNFSDIIIGSPFEYRGADSTKGAAFVYLGAAAMDSVSDVLLRAGDTNTTALGFSIATGDRNSDGYDDVCIGSPLYLSNAGAVYWFYGGIPMNGNQDEIFAGQGANHQTGYAVAAGDMNNDNNVDFIIGEFGLDRTTLSYGPSNSGRINFLLAQSPSDRFGQSAATADVNGDGSKDIIIGANGRQSGTGRVYIYDGNEYYPQLKIDLSAIIQGFYDPATNAMISDTLTVQLRSSVTPYSLVEEVKTVQPASGSSIVKFPQTTTIVPYYIVVKHRNSIETWTASPWDLALNTTPIVPFYITADSAYGSNQVQVDQSPVRYAIYSGDVNQDGTIDATDESLIDNAAANYLTGYVATDVTGDDYVDGTDFAITDNNAANFISVQRP